MNQQIDVLDHGYVHLIQVYGSDESIIEAARMSTAKGFKGWGPVHEEGCPANYKVESLSMQYCQCKPKPGDEKLLAFLYRNEHMTPFEMAGMIIEVKAPIFVFREWHRHRTQSYNEMSARYIPLPDENYVPTVERILSGSRAAADAANKQARGATTKVATTEDVLRDQVLLANSAYKDPEEWYQYFLNAGWPKELARLVVPVGRYSKMRASANLRNWLGFLKLRMAPNAQWEIRQYANAVGLLIEKMFPRTWELFTELNPPRGS